jgi:hypothetical protein
VLLEDFTDGDKAANLPEFIDITPEMLIRINNRLD